MPWSVEDVDSHKKGLSDKGKKQWCRIANSVLKRCMAKGGSEETCAASAIKQANGAVNTNAEEIGYSFYKSKQTLDYEPKITVHQGKAHLVVPVVMMVEGVHNGSLGPILHPIAELGKFPETWNGIPVLIYHAYDEDGNPVSANDPDIIDKVAVGKVYNTKVDGAKLKAEVWLDEDKLNEVSDKTLNEINNSKEIEVSLGMYADYKQEEGEWNGEKYSSVAYNHRPDHLAILPDQIGACSCKDGCGIGANQKDENMDENKMILTLREAGYSVFKILNNAGEEYQKRISMAYDALRSLDVHVYNYLEELYDDYLIYSQSGKEETKMYKQAYKLESGKIEFVGAPVEVHRKVEYVVNSGLTRTKFNVNSNLKKEVKMASDCTPCIKKKVDELIANSQGRWTEEDRAMLETLNETQLDKMKPVEVTKEVEKVVTVNAMSDEDKAALAAYRAEQKAKRDTLISDIQANSSKELWPSEVLNGMSDEILKKLFSSVKREEVVNYSLQGEVVVNKNNNAPKPLAPTGIKFKTTK
jgi:hypothetical protein